MSRIDRALRIAEGTAVVEETDRAEAPQTTPHRLNDYPRERPVVRAIPARSAGEPEPAVSAVLPAGPAHAPAGAEAAARRVIFRRG